MKTCLMKSGTTFLFLILFGAVCLAEEAEPLQWQPLFNGENLDGWDLFITGQPDNEDRHQYFTVHDGMIHTYRQTDPDTRVSYGVIMTKKEYSHYRLRFEYKWGTKKFVPRKKSKRDAGLLFHCFGLDRSKWVAGGFPQSVECQVQEGDTGDTYLVASQARSFVSPSAPSIYLPEAKGGIAKSIPEVTTGPSIGTQIGRIRRSQQLDRLEGWNLVEVEVRGDQARYWVNGFLVMELFDMKKPMLVNGVKTWVPLEKGTICFQCEASEIFYRKIQLAPVSKKGFSTE